MAALIHFCKINAVIIFATISVVTKLQSLRHKEYFD